MIADVEVSLPLLCGTNSPEGRDGLKVEIRVRASSAAFECLFSIVTHMSAVSILTLYTDKRHESERVFVTKRSEIASRAHLLGKWTSERLDIEVVSDGTMASFSRRRFPDIASTQSQTCGHQVNEIHTKIGDDETADRPSSTSTQA